MALIVYRSPKVEVLKSALAVLIEKEAPQDPFLSFPVVVGSKGMESWLRVALTRELSSLMQVDFPFPKAAIDGAMKLVLEEGPLKHAFWRKDLTRGPSPWEGAAFLGRVLTSLRRLHASPELSALSRYLGPQFQEAPLGFRELSFAQMLARTLDEFMHERPHDALALHEGKEESLPKPTVPFIGTILRALSEDLKEGDDVAPYLRHQALQAKLEKGEVPSQPLGTLPFFGLSTLGKGERLRLRMLSHFFDIHLFLLRPSAFWMEDLLSEKESLFGLPTQAPYEERRLALIETQKKNLLLRNFGRPSRLIQAWLEDGDYLEGELCTLPGHRGLEVGGGGAQGIGDFGMGGAPLPAPGMSDQAVLSPIGLSKERPPSFLHRLQAWIEDAEDMPPQDMLWSYPSPGESYPSLAFFKAHSALRQCEVLRDELLKRFLDDPSLEPQDVLIMTPDLPNYAPLLKAVLSREDKDKTKPLPFIPSYIADMGLRAENPIANVLLQVFAFSSERVSASAILDFLALPPVLERFDLNQEDLLHLREIVLRSQMRWAWDEEDRAAFSQPPLHFHTVEFALQRLSLGALQGEISPLETSLGMVPEPLYTREEQRLLGILLSLLKSLRALSKGLKSPAPMKEWLLRMEMILDCFSPPGGERAKVLERLQDLLPTDAKASESEGEGAPLLVDASALSYLLERKFQESRGGDRPVTGRVTVSSLEPMRSVPFRVICLLGMDEGKFPRQRFRAHWDPFLHPQKDELDEGDVDRHLILEALLSARDQLLIFYTGFEGKRGDPVPPSLVVEELIEVTGKLSGLKAEEIVKVSSLQPWNPRNFRRDGQAPSANGLPSGRESFDTQFLNGAKAIEAGLSLRQRGEKRVGPRQDAAFHLETKMPKQMTGDELAMALDRPQKELLEKGLGLRLTRYYEPLGLREPLRLGGLENWSLRQELWESIKNKGLRHGRLEEFNLEAHEALAFEVLSQKGLLPPKGKGELTLRAEFLPLVELYESWRACPSMRSDGPEGSLRLNEIQVYGRAPLQGKEGELSFLEWLIPSRLKDGDLLKAWVNLLILKATHEQLSHARLLYLKPEGSGRPPSPDELFLKAPSASESRALLLELLSLYQALSKEAIPLFPGLSHELIEGIQGKGEPLSPTFESHLSKAKCSLSMEALSPIWKKLSKSWDEIREKGGHMPYVEKLFGGLDFDALLQQHGDGFLYLAERVFSPIRLSLSLGEALNLREGRGHQRQNSGKPAPKPENQAASPKARS